MPIQPGASQPPTSPCSSFVLIIQLVEEISYSEKARPLNPDIPSPQQLMLAVAGRLVMLHVSGEALLVMGKRNPELDTIPLLRKNTELLEVIAVEKLTTGAIDSAGSIAIHGEDIAR